jgi:hypothetical protein
VLSKNNHTYLKERIGDDIITASGSTLLGADDKAGIAIIMDFAQLIMTNTEIKHGDIRILFTPDEEIGQGVDKIDMKKLNADFGYTLDGGERGHLEDESFSANGATATFKGISAHPGYAKGKMVSALKAAAHFIDLLPSTSWCPEATEGDEGFVHPMHVEGVLEEASVQFIVRDFDTQKLQEHEDRLLSLLKETEAAFPGIETSLTVKEQYRNMREVLDKHPEVMAYAAQAYKKAGIEPEIMKIIIQETIHAINCSSQQEFVPNNPIYVNINSIDFFKQLQINPDGNKGKFYYEKKPFSVNDTRKSLNRELYKRTQNPNQSFSNDPSNQGLLYQGGSGQNLFNITFVNQDNNGNQQQKVWGRGSRQMDSGYNRIVYNNIEKDGRIADDDGAENQ